MPCRHRVEHRPDLESLGELREVNGPHRNIRRAAVALSLEVVLPHPERVVAGPVHQLSELTRLAIDRDEIVIRRSPAFNGRARESEPVHLDVATVEAVEVFDHLS